MRIVDNLGLDKKEAGHKRRHLNLYTLRKYFRNNIKTSEPAFKEFWMGHSLGVDKHYFEAHIDDPKTIERHREEYAAGYAFLRVDVESPNVKSMKEIEELRRENDVLKAQMANMVSKEDIQALIDKAIDDAFESRGHWAQAGRRHLKDKK
jgi:cell division protein FtsB